MKSFGFLRSVISALALASCALVASPAFAAAVSIAGPGLNYTPNLYLYGTVAGDFSTPYTNSTTTATTLTGMSVTIPATSRDFTKQYLCVRYSVDATKATATTGAIQVSINGAVDPAATRYTSSGAGRNTVANQYCVLRTARTASVVTLLGVSGDTNAFTVNGAFMEVWNYTLN